MIKYVLNTFHLLFLCITLTQANATVSGKIEVFKNEKIYLLELNDAFSNSFKVIDSTLINDKGWFSFDYKVATPKIYFLKFDVRKIEIILEPDVAYEVYIKAPKSIYATSQSFQVIYQGAFGNYQKYLFNYIDELQLDFYSILELSKTFTNDSIKNAEINLFVNNLSVKYADAKLRYPWFANEIYFRTFKLLNSFEGKGKDSTIIEFMNEHIDYQSQSFIDLLRLLTRSIIEKENLIHDKKIREAINSQSPYLDLLEIFNESFETKGFNNTLVHLTLIDAIHRKRIIGITDENFVMLLNHFIKIAPDDNLKSIVKQLIRNHTLLKKGSKAPLWLLPNHKNKMVETADFKGKYIYLQFWSTWNTSSLIDLRLMEELYKNYNKQIEFISINVNRNENEFINYIENKKYPWTLLWFNKDFQLLENFAVTTFPMYYFIDSDGYMYRSPAEKPELMIQLFNTIKAGDEPKAKSYEIIRTYDED